jgi:four helix bundle protein
MKQNILLEKTFDFALNAVKLSQKLQNENREFVLSKQFLRSATSIGANAEEAVAGHSTNDFIAKLTIAQKEARETNYWLRLITASKMHDCTTHMQASEEIIRIISSIIITTKQRNLKQQEPIHNS